MGRHHRQVHPVQGMSIQQVFNTCVQSTDSQVCKLCSGSCFYRVGAALTQERAQGRRWACAAFLGFLNSAGSFRRKKIMPRPRTWCGEGRRAVRAAFWGCLPAPSTQLSCWALVPLVVPLECTGSGWQGVLQLLGAGLPCEDGL